MKRKIASGRFMLAGGRVVDGDQPNPDVRPATPGRLQMEAADQQWGRGIVEVDHEFGLVRARLEVFDGPAALVRVADQSTEAAEQRLTVARAGAPGNPAPLSVIHATYVDRSPGGGYGRPGQPRALQLTSPTADRSSWAGNAPRRPGAWMRSASVSGCCVSGRARFHFPMDAAPQLCRRLRPAVRYAHRRNVCPDVVLRGRRQWRDDAHVRMLLHLGLTHTQHTEAFHPEQTAEQP